MWTRMFWQAAAERAIRTMAQTLLALWLSDDVFNVLSVDWLNALGVALGAAVFSLLMSLVPAGPDGSPSWVRDPAAGRHAR